MDFLDWIFDMDVLFNLGIESLNYFKVGSEVFDSRFGSRISNRLSIFESEVKSLVGLVVRFYVKDFLFKKRLSVSLFFFFYIFDKFFFYVLFYNYDVDSFEYVLLDIELFNFLVSIFNGDGVFIEDWDFV